MDMSDSITITESGMDFCCKHDNFFHIEKNSVYAKLKDVKIVEFLLLKKPLDLWLVEAKSSAPNPQNKTDLDEYAEEIFNKMTCSLAFYLSLSLGRFDVGPQCMPLNFQQLDLAKVNFKFVLIVRRQKTEWIKDLQDKLSPMFTKVSRSYNIHLPSFVVINAKIAKDKGIISSYLEGNQDDGTEQFTNQRHIDAPRKNKRGRENTV